MELRVAYSSSTFKWCRFGLELNGFSLGNVFSSVLCASRKLYYYSLNRIKSEDFKTLEENIGQPIQIADNVKLQRSRTERFIEVFRDQVSQNPVYNGYSAAEVCI